MQSDFNGVMEKMQMVLLSMMLTLKELQVKGDAECSDGEDDVYLRRLDSIDALSEKILDALEIIDGMTESE